MLFHGILASIQHLYEQRYNLYVRITDINEEPVELYKILKFEGLVASGGQAKQVIENGQVRVNGQTETRKRKKIVDGDIITFATETLKIRRTEPDKQAP